MSLFGKKEINISFGSQTIIRVIVLIAVTLIALRFLNNITRPLILIFISFFLALALNPAVSWITNRLKSKSRARATGAAYLAVLVVLISFFSLVLPPLISQTTKFVRDIPSTIRSLETQDTALARFARRYNIDDQIREVGNDLSSKFGDIRKPILSTAGRVGGTLISIITVFVLTFMMLVEGPYWLSRLAAIQAESKREHRKQLAMKMYKVVTGYVNGQLLIALIAGGFALVTLLVASTILGVSINAVALAGIVTLTGLIPMIGNTIGALLVVLISLFSSTPLAIVMAIFFLLYQQIENVTIQPHIQSKNNNLTPMLVFIATILGVGLGGILGALVAIPTMGCIKILVEDHFTHHKV